MGLGGSFVKESVIRSSCVEKCDECTGVFRLREGSGWFDMDASANDLHCKDVEELDGGRRDGKVFLRGCTEGGAV